jgi:transcriptional regulator with XRE-family HTH domain
MSKQRELGMPLPGLRPVRTWRRLTVRALAARADVAPTTITRIEGGKPALFTTLDRLAAALDVAPELLAVQWPDSPNEQREWLDRAERAYQEAARETGAE